ncbi:Lipoate-protein ligase A [hydrothermal vent metagenome]|uniref:Lipoate-protein ligase A n=1 Tax=hydrothermal vent metagenome TaxID=652676 RepID=A0A3B1CD37_9ZZZZ
MGEVWRLIEDGPAPGEWNMAVDTALLESAEAGASAPTLRLYGWDRATLSIGYLQKKDGWIDLEYLEKNRIPVVRRPTGGRALVHDDEVTYSVTIPSSSLFYGSLRQIYGMVTGAIVKALGDIGVKADTGRAQPGSRASALCHATKTSFEISLKGRKIVCGAQRRLKSSAMQHGAIALGVDKEQALSCFIWGDEKWRKMAERKMGGLNDFLKKPVSAQEVGQALINSFEKLYEIEFKKGELTRVERETAGALTDGASAVYGR